MNRVVLYFQDAEMGYWLKMLLFSFSFCTYFNLNTNDEIFFENTEIDDEAFSIQLLLQEIMVKYLVSNKCVSIITDNIYGVIFQKDWFKRFNGFLSVIFTKINDSDDLLIPPINIQNSLLLSNHEDCQLHIILLSNGLQTIRLLRYGDRYRVINTRSKFLILFDNRLFDRNYYYLWRRLINVVFIRQYSNQKQNSHSRAWIELTTVPFPQAIPPVFVPKRLDIWANLKFRRNVDLFQDKTKDLRNQTLRIAIFPHIPGITKQQNLDSGNRGRTLLTNGIANYSGAEIEIIATVANAMNFQCEIYEPKDIDTTLWGGYQDDGKYTGLVGEMIYTRADIALGDLYYTPYILDLMDLSVPYNTECLTFLTPEALTDNSWKTLILPFKPTMWAVVIVCLIICSFIFHYLARFHEEINRTRTKQNQPIKIDRKKIVTLSLFQHIPPDMKYSKLKEIYNQPKDENQPVGLYQFTEPVNSILYAYSMLLLVSIPKLPTGWSLRVLTGWYWLYCLLVVVAYRASMTAILSQPMPRIRIDSLQGLLDSHLSCGGWGEINRQFFTTSSDPVIKEIGRKFQIITSIEDAVDRVAQGQFAFYENTYFLKQALVNRQMRYQSLHANLTSSHSLEVRSVTTGDRSLHIMNDCVIKIPISLGKIIVSPEFLLETNNSDEGLQKNSPIKPTVDKIIRRVLEAGLIKRWIDDVMQKILNSEIQNSDEHTKAIMNMKKFFGAIVALLIGYFISIIILLVEIGHFHIVVKKNPNYNKYSRNIQSVRKMK